MKMICCGMLLTTLACGSQPSASGDRPITTDQTSKPPGTPDAASEYRPITGAPKGLPPGTYALETADIPFIPHQFSKFAEAVVAKLKSHPRSYYSLSPMLGYSWIPGNCWRALQAEIQTVAKGGNKFTRAEKFSIEEITVSSSTIENLVSGELVLKAADGPVSLLFALPRSNCNFTYAKADTQ